MDNITFIAVRCLVLAEQHNVFYQPLSAFEKQKALIGSIFEGSKDYRTTRGIDFSLITLDQKDNIFIGKMARKMKRKTHVKTDNDIVEELIEDWPFLYFVCDINEQLLAIEHKTSFDITIPNICRIIEDIAKQNLSKIGYKLSLEPIPEKGSFWEIIANSQRIYSVKFSMDSPNFFGGKYKTDDFLKEISNMFHNTKTSIELLNDKGELNISEENINDVVNMAEAGGGQWEIKSKVHGKKRKKLHKSTDRLKGISIDLPEGKLSNDNYIKFCHKAISELRDKQ